MGRIVLAVVIGLLSLFVVIVGGELFQELFRHGTPLEDNSIWEVVGGGLLVGFYLAIGQFLVASRKGPGLLAKWPTMVGMAAPLIAICLLSAAMEGHGQWAFLTGVILLGCAGIFAGAAAAGRFTLQALSLGTCRRSLRAAAALMVGVALVVAAGVVPLTRADTFPTATPEKAVPVFWGAAILNLLGAACLMFIGARAGRGRRPSPVDLGSLAFLSFVVAFLLAPTVTFMRHGPSMVIAGILGGLCAVVEFAVTLLIGSIALRLPTGEPA